MFHHTAQTHADFNLILDVIVFVVSSSRARSYVVNDIRFAVYCPTLAVHAYLSVGLMHASVRTQDSMMFISNLARGVLDNGSVRRYTLVPNRITLERRISSNGRNTKFCGRNAIETGDYVDDDFDRTFISLMVTYTFPRLLSRQFQARTFQCWVCPFVAQYESQMVR